MKTKKLGGSPRSKYLFKVSSKDVALPLGHKSKLKVHKHVQITSWILCSGGIDLSLVFSSLILIRDFNPKSLGKESMSEKCPNTEFFLVRIQSECRKIWTMKNCIGTLHAVNPSNISILANKCIFYSPKTTLKQSKNSYINNKNTRTAPMGVLSNVFIVNFDLEISQ